MPSKPKNIYALFVAIDKYQPPMRSLFGCVNDYESLHSFLSTHYDENSYVLHAINLCNDKATRQGIINGFTHFDAAQDGDICLFYYSGHGAQRDAPEAFWYLESGQKMESIVCYDSRPNGRDLADKELSYLLWRIKKDKDIHLLVIMDCCHANNNTRGEEEQSVSIYQERIRSAEGQEQEWPVSSYLGFEEYEEVAKGEFSPPRTSYIQLSACDSYQKAKEVFTGSGNRGVFTYALIMALKDKGAFLSYHDLMKRVKMKMFNLVKDQTAVLSAWPNTEKNKSFLGGGFSTMREEYTIVRQKGGEWIINGGKLHGFCGADDEAATCLRLIPEGDEVQVDKVGLSQSTVAGMGRFSARNSYQAKLVSGGKKFLKVSFAPHIEKIGKQLLLAEQERFVALGIQLSDDPESIEYYMHAEDQSFFLTKLPLGHPVFKRLSGYSQQNAIHFLEQISVLTNWSHVRSLSKQPVTISADDIDLTFYRVVSVQNDYHDDEPTEIIGDTTAIDLPYLYNGRKWQKPAFQIKLRNNSDTALYLSGLFLGYDYSVTNQLLAHKRLEPGDELWFLEEGKSYSYRTICMELQDDYYDAGITQATDELRILVSTAAFYTDDLNRQGLPFEAPPVGPLRTPSLRGHDQPDDWFFIDLKCNVFRPMERRRFDAQTPYHYGDLLMEAPPGFIAKVKLSNQQEWKRALGIEKVGPKPAGYRFDPIVFWDQLGYAEGLSVIEISDFGPDEEVQFLEEPLILQLPASWGQELVPVDYDKTNQVYRDLQHEWEGEKLLIWELPKATAIFPNGDYFSRKLFLL